MKMNPIDKLAVIEDMFPNAKCELNHETPFQLAVAVALSAQTTDVRVNIVTKELFGKYPDAKAFNELSLDVIKQEIKSIGLYHNKAKNLKEMAKQVVELHDNILPSDRESLEKLAGIGRKSANVILSECFNVPAIAVDTHVERVSKRIKLVPKTKNVLEVEKILMRKIPKDKWIQAHHLLIFWGRYQCMSKNPNCNNCPLITECCYKDRLRLEK